MNSTEIIEKFGVKPANIYKCKYYYVINSTEGCYMLSPARPSKDKIEKIHNYKEKIQKSGFFALDSYMLTKEGKPYAEYGGEVFTLTKYFGDSELNINSDIQVGIALETIGKLHYAIKNINDEAMVYAASADNPLITGYEKQINALHKLKKNAGSPYKNDFDLTLSKYISPVTKKAENALSGLKKLGYGNNMTICHNSLKEGNIIYNKGRCHIIDWDNMKNAHFLEDSAFFIKRYMRKALFYNMGNMKIDELYGKYVKFNKLSQNQEDIFCQLMDYPHRFAALMLEYYKKNRGFVPSGMKNKLEECIKQWEE